MTIQDAKDQVAKTRNCKDWKHFLEKVCFTAGYISASELVADEVSQLYGDSQYNQALGDALKILSSDEALTNPHFKYSEELKRLKR